jgi:superfamily II DNA or RNA helicase
MAKLEAIANGIALKGVLPGKLVTVVATQFYSSDAVNLTYRDANGTLGEELIYRDRESELEIVVDACPWSFNGDGAMLRLVSEAYRIHLAHLFDPLLAVHTSLVEPLPHQITAVYGEMLKRQPLRFLLADDPGAGKTIMAGLLMRELMMRGDLHRCLVVCPGSLATQWQDELEAKFQLPFEILTNDRMEAARTGNALAEMSFVIARLDQLSRSEDLQDKLSQTDWDLIICDEAHKMSASFFGNDIRETKRYKLGRLLGGITRNFLLMTATPHNGKEEDFQLFLRLLDLDRFEGRFRDGVHASDVSDLMRRMIKEDLLKFDGKPLFPERIAETVNYSLSSLEQDLYDRVTEYVREEFNRADRLSSGRKGTVGFALTILQRRLASSPEAIYQSLHRRRERLQKRYAEEDLMNNEVEKVFSLEDFDEDDLGADELESVEETVVDRATAAQTLAELQTEIKLLEELEKLALKVRRSSTDRKWEQLSQILQDSPSGSLPLAPNAGGTGSGSPPALGNLGKLSSKLVIFTEHRDTLNYLCEKIRVLLGNSDAVVSIHGSVKREDRKNVEERFKQDPDVRILVATDAAGEGINLQQAHLMVNYDLPWNPNRLEQRFGRIHRIGQTEVCRLWNLVAVDTREGEVYQTLFDKLDRAREDLQGKVFDVLGKAISGKELRELLIESIRYGNSPAVRARLEQTLFEKLDRDRLQQLLDEEVLDRTAMDASRVQEIREDMERMLARRLQPHFVESFFLTAFDRLGGKDHQRETGRYELRNVPAILRHYKGQTSRREPILPRYERICFDKNLINIPGKPTAAFICPGHPLLDATIALILGQYQDLLKQGAILVDENDESDNVRVLVYLDHSIHDARQDERGQRRLVSRRMQYMEIYNDGRIQNMGSAPYLDYRPLLMEEEAYLEPLHPSELFPQDVESLAQTYAITDLVPDHLQEIKTQKLAPIEKTKQAVQERLTKEIQYWDRRAIELQAQEAEGKVNAKLNSNQARQRADELESRLERRLAELDLEKQLSPAVPVTVGGALIVPIGLLKQLQGVDREEPSLFARETKRVELAAMDAVIAIERRLGNMPVDVSAKKCGYDIESRDGATGRLRFIEVKGRIAGADTVTVTKNEILTALNLGDSRDSLAETLRERDGYILALVEVPDLESGDECRARYLKQPFKKEPDFRATSVNYQWSILWDEGIDPLDRIAY